jgi:hypothetical protein
MQFKEDVMGRGRTPLSTVHRFRKMNNYKLIQVKAGVAREGLEKHRPPPFTFHPLPFKFLCIHMKAGRERDEAQKYRPPPFMPAGGAFTPRLLPCLAGRQALTFFFTLKTTHSEWVLHFMSW